MRNIIQIFIYTLCLNIDIRCSCFTFVVLYENDLTPNARRMKERRRKKERERERRKGNTRIVPTTRAVSSREKKKGKWK